MREVAAVFIASLLFLSWGAATPGLATGYVDPIARIHAQDEALYAASSLEMARHGGWMTPRFLDRYALYKPPLLYWVSAILLKLGCALILAVRLPSIAAGAAAVALVFAWVRLTMPLAAAIGAAGMLLSNHLFFVLSRTGLTDAMLIFEITLALYAAARDPKLERSLSRWIFGIATGAAIMTKALAGLLPLAILAFCGVPLLRFLQVTAIAASVAIPWHAWQFYAHPRWFWAEYVLGEHVTWGLAAPQQSTQEPHIAYYASRLILLDPFLCAAFAWTVFRKQPRIVLAWTAVILTSVALWRYRNATYLAPLIPAMAIAVWQRIQPVKLALAVAAILLAAKIFIPHQPFSLRFAAESAIPSEAALDAYAAKHRTNDLVIVDSDDQLYSACLNLPRVRYVWLDPSANRPRLPLDFEYLGITVTASDFARLDQLRPTFEKRLHEWSLDSAKPVATTILAQTAAEITELIAAHPEADFFVPKSLESTGHERWAMGDRAFLLSRVVIQRP